jgi:NAD-dependent deacetylase
LGIIICQKIGNGRTQKPYQRGASPSRKSQLFTFLTGAGVSAASGIPTYRGTDGIWVKGTKFDKPEEFGTFEYFKKQPE